MNRAAVQGALNLFFGRAGSVSIADLELATQYLKSLKAYIAALEESYEALDPWSVPELERATDYLFHNLQWITGWVPASSILTEAFSLIQSHRYFLSRSALLPAHLEIEPRNAFNSVVTPR